MTMLSTQQTISTVRFIEIKPSDIEIVSEIIRKYMKRVHPDVGVKFETETVLRDRVILKMVCSYDVVNTNFRLIPHISNLVQNIKQRHGYSLKCGIV